MIGGPPRGSMWLANIKTDHRSQITATKFLLKKQKKVHTAHTSLPVGAGVRVVFMCTETVEKLDCTYAAWGKPGLGQGRGGGREGENSGKRGRKEVYVSHSRMTGWPRRLCPGSRALV